MRLQYMLYFTGAKMKAWDITIMLVEFMILNVKAIILIAVDLYQFLFPPPENIFNDQLVLVSIHGSLEFPNVSLLL